MGISYSDLQYFSGSIHTSHGILISEEGVAADILKKTSALANAPTSLGEDFVPRTEKGIMLEMPCGHWWLNLI